MARLVLPAVEAGLHCGMGSGTTLTIAKRLVLPAVEAGLHCGVLDSATFGVLDTSSPGR